MNVPISARAALVAAMVLCIGSSAYGQYGRRRAPIRRYSNSAQQPFVDPVLNITGISAIPGLNYATIVQPFEQQQRNQEMQRGQIRWLNNDQRRQNAMQATPYGNIVSMRATGAVAATYGNYSHYYPRLSGSGGGAAPRDYKIPQAPNFANRFSGGGMF